MSFNLNHLFLLVSTYVVWETICDAQAGFWLNSKFLSKFSRKPLSGISDQKAPPPFGKLQIWGDQKFTLEYPPLLENFRFEMTKILIQNTPWPLPPPHFGKLQIWDDQSLLWNTPPPHFRKLQTWDDQSLLRNTPPPPPFWKTSDLRWPTFTLEYPPPLFRKMREIVCGD